METKTTLKTFNLEAFKELKVSGRYKMSNSLIIVHAIANHQKISDDIWEYFSEDKGHRQAVLVDILKRIPDKHLNEKKKIIDILFKVNYFEGMNKAREWTERLVSSKELSKYFLNKVFGEFTQKASTLKQ
jgi:hypothetical protein